MLGRSSARDQGRVALAASSWPHHLGPIALAALPWPYRSGADLAVMNPKRPGRITQAVSPWPHCIGRIALAALHWPYRPVRIPSVGKDRVAAELHRAALAVMSHEPEGAPAELHRAASPGVANGTVPPELHRAAYCACQAAPSSLVERETVVRNPAAWLVHDLRPG